MLLRKAVVWCARLVTGWLSPADDDPLPSKFDNIQKFIIHLLLANLGEVVLLVIGLAFRDADDLSVFPIAPLQVLLINTITGFPAFALGLEKAQPNVMRRRPSRAMFTWEVITDLCLYGFMSGSLSLATFVIVVYGTGSGNLGRNCNASYSPECETVFKARAACYVQIMWLLCFVAWELKSLRRSLFLLNPNSNFARDMWQNKMLFFIVIASALSVFPVVMIDGLNTKVFKQQRISWEWSLPVAGLVIFIVFIELWKLTKRKLHLFEEPAVHEHTQYIP